MNIIDQNKAIASLEYTLEHHTHLIDSRTEKDDLSFLVNFSSLLNFYDQNNKVNGDWTPFLLKDPVFLIASIAKTPFKKMYSLFLQSCITCQEVLNNKELTSFEKKQNEALKSSINQIFNQVFYVFNLLERWIHYMMKSPLEYNLKSYVIKEVKEKYAQFLWALLWLKEQLVISKLIEGIEEVSKFIYKSFNQKVWKNSNEKIPYAELLGLKYPFIENTESSVYDALKKTGEIVFSFFNSIIEYAPVEFKNLQKDKDLYPDTLLLQTFTELMKIYRNQINGLSRKHLNFYYKDVLRQKKLHAVPDAVFVCADLSEINTPFKLIERKLFNGGQYEDESTILYKNIEEVSLNPAAIVEAYTVSKQKPLDNFSKLYLKKQKEVNTVQKDEEGNTKSWQTFGSQISSNGKEVQLGFAVASPMLLLKEGHRELTLKFTFSKKIKITDLFNKGKYYLSTEEGWYLITKDQIKISFKGPYGNEVEFVITLDVEQPPIVAFIENPDKLESSWPIFKMCYKEFTDVTIPLKIRFLEISVNVEELHTFQLYNDFGLLESEKPFQLLGPIPEKGQSFMIGNAEVFSKPVATFSIEIDWNNLPEDFAIYYEQYNKFLSGYYNFPKENYELFKESQKKPSSSFFSFNWFPFIWRKDKKKEEFILIPAVEPFNDRCFKVEFQLLQNKNWIPVKMESRDCFLESLLIKNKEKTYIKEFLTGELKVGVDVSLKVAEVLSISTHLKIDKLLSIEDCFTALVYLKINKELEIKDKLEISDFFKIEERLTINNVLKIRKEITLEFLLKNRDIIKVTELFELNERLKIKDVFLLNANVTVDNTLLIEKHLNKSTSVLVKNHTVKSLSLQLEGDLLIDSSLKITDVLEIDTEFLLKDLLNVKGEGILKIKEGVKLTDLLEIDSKIIDNEIKYGGEFVIENEFKEVISLDISGKLHIDNEISVDNILEIHSEFSFEEAIEVNKERVETEINVDNIESPYIKELFQGELKVGADVSLKITDILSVNIDLKIDILFSLEDYFTALVYLKINKEIEIIDKLEISGFFKIEERLMISDVLKIKEELTIEFLLKNEETIKVTELFQLNEHLKIKDVILIDADVSVENTFLIKKQLSKLTSVLVKNHTVKSLNLQLEGDILIDSSLRISDILEIDTELLLKDILNIKGKEIIKIKEGVKLTDLLETNSKTFDKEIKHTGELVIEDEFNEVVSLDLSGKLHFDEKISVENILDIHSEFSFEEVIEVNNERVVEIEIDKNFYEELYNYSNFESLDISEVQGNRLDPTIQNTPLEFTETTNSGFIRMQLIDPRYGFGASIYSKVVSTIALYNAELIALAFNPNEIEVPLESPANEPYIPVVGLFKGSYSSTKVYDFAKKKLEYPIQIFYYDIFKNYKVYDSNFSVDKNKLISNGFPILLPKNKNKGQLFLALEGVITPAEISFYFELTQDYMAVINEKKNIQYKYLTKTGWKKLPVIANSTNNFSCSGIITFNVASDISKVHHTMPNGKYWISIGVDNNPDSFCQTSFLKTNGFKLERTGKEFRTSPRKPEITANTIENSHEAIPQIATIVQPFSSFGGKSAETERHMNKRVSVRLKTKDRVVTNQDYYRVITETFEEIFFNIAIYKRESKSTKVYLVQKIKDKTASNAFMPLVSECLQQKIKEYLEERTSSFANVQVANFELRYLKIEGKVEVVSGNSAEGVAKEINAGINVFLSPWITTLQSQIVINKGISVAQISEFIKSYKSVKSIDKLKLYLGIKIPGTENITYKGPYHTVPPTDTLLVPSLDNQSITYK